MVVLVSYLDKKKKKSYLNINYKKICPFKTINNA